MLINMVGDLSSSKTQFLFSHVWLTAEIDAEFVFTVWYTCNMNSCTLGNLSKTT